MRNARTVRPSESLRAVAMEARQKGCIVQIDPVKHLAFIRPRRTGLKHINQLFYGVTA
jgi:hypothetical protein